MNPALQQRTGLVPADVAGGEAGVVQAAHGRVPGDLQSEAVICSTDLARKTERTQRTHGGHAAHRLEHASARHYALI
jgi:hypothetical protein